MEHVDEELLALMALGENVPGHDHVEACAQCRQEVDELSSVVSAVRGGDTDLQAEDELSAPPSSVWAAIHSELGLDADLLSDPLQKVPAAPQRPVLHSVPTVQEAPSAGDSDIAPTRLHARRRRFTWAVAGAAAAGLVIGGVGISWLQPDNPATPQPTLVAEINLDPLEGWTAEGLARVEAADDGSQELVVDMPTDVNDAGYREVWLINPDVERMVSLGALTGTEATFAIPDGLDLAEFPIVDISLEQFDGNPAHSGDSILRGILPT